MLERAADPPSWIRWDPVCRQVGSLLNWWSVRAMDSATRSHSPTCSHSETRQPLAHLAHSALSRPHWTWTLLNMQSPATLSYSSIRADALFAQGVSEVSSYLSETLNFHHLKKICRLCISYLNRLPNLWKFITSYSGI